MDAKPKTNSDESDSPGFSHVCSRRRDQRCRGYFFHQLILESYPDPMRIMKKRTAQPLWLAALFVSAWLSGCGGSGGPNVELAPAAGVAQFDGQPLGNASIAFYPAEGPVGTATTDASGQFRIKTNGQNGAVVGENRVTVAAAFDDTEIPETNGSEADLVIKAPFPDFYSDPEKTDLILNVPPEGNEEFSLDLTP